MDSLTVGTPLGSLIVKEKTDAVYPGITVDFKGKSGEEAYCACIEYDPNEGAIRTHIYGDKYSDEPTISTTYKNFG